MTSAFIECELEDLRDERRPSRIATSGEAATKVLLGVTSAGDGVTAVRALFGMGDPE